MITKGAVAESATSVTVQEGNTGNTAPSVDLALSATSVNAGTAVTLSSQATDSDGTVDKVDFFVNSTLVGTSATAPFTLVYTPAQAGTLNIHARATDNLGATSDSSTVQLIVNGGSVAKDCRPDGLYQTEGITVPILYCL